MKISKKPQLFYGFNLIAFYHENCYQTFIDKNMFCFKYRNKKSFITMPIGGRPPKETKTPK